MKRKLIIIFIVYAIIFPNIVKANSLFNNNYEQKYSNGIGTYNTFEYGSKIMGNINGDLYLSNHQDILKIDSTNNMTRLTTSSYWIGERRIGGDGFYTLLNAHWGDEYFLILPTFRLDYTLIKQATTELKNNKTEHNTIYDSVYLDGSYFITYSSNGYYIAQVKASGEAINEIPTDSEYKILKSSDKVYFAKTINSNSTEIYTIESNKLTLITKINDLVVSAFIEDNDNYVILNNNKTLEIYNKSFEKQNEVNITKNISNELDFDKKILVTDYGYTLYDKNTKTLYTYTKNLEFAAEDKVNISYIDNLSKNTTISGPYAMNNEIIFAGSYGVGSKTDEAGDYIIRLSVKKHKITSNVINGNGKIELSDETATIGDKITYQIDANEGYELQDLSIKTISGRNVERFDGYFIMPDEDVILTINFVLKKDVDNNKNNEDNQNPESNPNTADKLTIIILLITLTSMGLVFYFLEKQQKLNE